METTAFIITVCVIIITLYDLFAVTYWGIEKSISRFVNVIFCKAPIVTFGCGMLTGHFLIPVNPPSKEEMNSIPVLRQVEIDQLKEEFKAQNVRQ